MIWTGRKRAPREFKPANDLMRPYTRLARFAKLLRKRT